MDNLRFGVEWDVNESSLQASMNNCRKSIEGVEQSVESLEASVNRGLSTMVGNSSMLNQSWEQLSIQAKSYERIVRTSLDPEIIAKYNRLLAETQAKMAQINSTGLNLNSPMANRPAWNGLQNSINQIGRELPAFTFSVQTGLMALSNNIPILADEIGRLKHENDALVASGQKGIPIWKQIASSLLSWNTLVSVGLTLLTIYGKEIGDWISAMFKGGEAAQAAAMKIDIMNKTLTGGEYGRAIKDITELRSAIDGAKSGVVSKDDALKLYNSTIGKTTGELKSWKDLESWQLANEKKYLEFMYRKAEAQAILQVAIDKTIEAQKKSIEGPSFVDYAKAYANTGSINLEASAQIQNLIGIATLKSQASKGMTLFAEKNRELQEYAKKNGFDLYQFKDTKTRDVTARVISEHKSLMEELKNIDAEYSSEFYTDDQKELAAFDEKFRKIREKIEDFNKDPKNFIKVDIQVMEDLEGKLRKDLLYKQETKGETAIFESDFESWKEFEDLKKKTSEEYARERFGKMGDYYSQLEERIHTAIGELRSKGDLTPQELHRLQQFYKILDDVVNYSNERQDEAVAEEAKKYGKLLEDYSSYQQKREKILKDSQEKIALFQAKGENDRAKEVENEAGKKLKELAVKEVEGLGGIDGLMEKMETMSISAQRQGIKAARKIFEEWIKQAQLTQDEVEELRRVFGKFFRDADTKNLETVKNDLREAFSAFSNITSDISAVDQQFGKVLKTITNIVGGTLDLNEQLKKVKTEGANFGNFMSIYGAMVQVGTNIFDAINQTVEQRWNDQVLVRTKALEAQNRLLEYQIALVDTLNGTDKLDQLRENVDALKEMIESTRKSLEGATVMSGDSFIDKLLSDLNSGKETVDSYTKRIENLKWRISTLGNTGSDAALGASLWGEIGKIQKALEFYRTSLKLTGKETVQELIELSGKVDEETAKRINDLIESEKKLVELSKDLATNILGFSSQNMVDEIASMFAQGKLSAKDFTDSFEGYMKQAIISSLRTNFLEKQLQELYSKMKDTVKGNIESGAPEDSPLDPQDLEELKRKYDEIINNGKKQLEAWSKVTGIDFEQEDSSTMSSSGIERVSEQTATELVGFQRSTYDIMKRQFNEVVKIVEFEQKSFDLLVIQIAHLRGIEVNTLETSNGLKAALNELKAISANTKGGVYGGR